jgi:hypothetical protein
LRQGPVVGFSQRTLINQCSYDLIVRAQSYSLIRGGGHNYRITVLAKQGFQSGVVAADKEKNESTSFLM